MIIALIHSGKYHGWHEINYEIYIMLHGRKLNREIVLLPTITAIIKVRPK